MIRYRNFAFATAVVAALSLGSAANADIVYDNLANMSGGFASVVNSGPLGNSFSTGSGDNALSDVKLLLNASDPSDGGTFVVLITTDASNSPNFSQFAVLDNVSDSSLTTSLAQVDIPVTTPIDLDPNTRYWIVLYSPTSSVNWSFATDDTGTGVPNEYNYYNGSSLPNSVFTPYQMQVSTVAVPEPSTFALGAIGICVLAIARRRYAG